MADELVGIINADSLEQLAHIVDEATDTKDCEYAKLPVGGILWDGPLTDIPGGKVPLPARDPETGEGPELPWGECSLSDSWCEAFYQEKKLYWHRFSDVEKPVSNVLTHH
jgi:hypothetical protein